MLEEGRDGLSERKGGRAWRRTAGCGLELLSWAEVVGLVASLRELPGEGQRERAAADLVATMAVAEELFGVVPAEEWSRRRHQIVRSPLRFLGMLAVERAGLGSAGQPAPWLWPDLSLDEEAKRLRALPWSVVALAASGWPLDRDEIPEWEEGRTARIQRVAAVVVGVADYFGMSADLTWRACAADILDTVDQLSAAVATPKGLYRVPELWPLAMCSWDWVVAVADGRAAVGQGSKRERAFAAVLQFVAEFGRTGPLVTDETLGSSPVLEDRWRTEMPTWMADRRPAPVVSAQ